MIIHTLSDACATSVGGVGNTSSKRVPESPGVELEEAAMWTVSYHDPEQPQMCLQLNLDLRAATPRARARDGPAPHVTPHDPTTTGRCAAGHRHARPRSTTGPQVLAGHHPFAPPHASRWYLRQEQALVYPWTTRSETMVATVTGALHRQTRRLGCRPRERRHVGGRRPWCAAAARTSVVMRVAHCW